MIEKIVCSGFGGQGVISLGQIISLLAMHDDKNVSWFPAYGAEMRGGTANCQVIYSDELVGSPIITNDISVLIAMNQPSIDKFLHRMIPGGLIIANSSVITEKIEAANLDIRYVDATNLATEIGSPIYQNMVILGALIASKNNFNIEQVEKAFSEKFVGSKEKYIPDNLKAVKIGMEKVV